MARAGAWSKPLTNNGRYERQEDGADRPYSTYLIATQERARCPQSGDKSTTLSGQAQHPSDARAAFHHGILKRLSYPVSDPETEAVSRAFRTVQYMCLPLCKIL